MGSARIRRGMLTLGRDPDVPGGSHRPTADRARRRGATRLSADGTAARAGAGRPRSQHDHGLATASAGVALAARRARRGPRRGGRADGLVGRRASASRHRRGNVRSSVAVHARGAACDVLDIPIATSGVAVAALARAVARRRCWCSSIPPPPAPTAAWSANAGCAPASLPTAWSATGGSTTAPAAGSRATRSGQRQRRHAGGPRSRGGLDRGAAPSAGWPWRATASSASTRSPSIDSIIDQVTIAGWGYLEGTIMDYATIASREDGTTIDQHYHISINSRGEVPALWLKTEDGTCCCKDRRPSRARPGSTSPAPTTGRRPASTSTASRSPPSRSPAASSSDTTPFILGANGNGTGDTNVTERFPGQDRRDHALPARAVAQRRSRSSTTACCSRPRPASDAGARD